MGFFILNNPREENFSCDFDLKIQFNYHSKVMKKGKFFFHPLDGSASLTISWSSGPKGDAVEAKKGAGVGFFSHKGDLLSVIFDEVQSSKDHQILEFSRYRIELTVKNAKVTYIVSEIKPPINRKKRVSRKQTA